MPLVLISADALKLKDHEEAKKTLQKLHGAIGQFAIGEPKLIPPGKGLHTYRKSPCLMGKLTIDKWQFSVEYYKLSEGNEKKGTC